MPGNAYHDPLPEAHHTRPVPVYLAFGGNMGDVKAHFTAALRELDAVTEEPVRTSRLYQTAPWGDPDQPEYLNLVAELFWDEENIASLHELCRNLELQAGRVHDEERRYGPRPLDIDILYAGYLTIDDPGLMVPHPRIAERRFVLIPLADLLPRNRVLPGQIRTLHELIEHCPDDGAVKPVSDGPWNEWRE